MSNPRLRKIGYWLATSLLLLPMGAGGVADILQPPQVAETFEHLGYPPYFAVMLGVAKLLGMATLLAPGLVRVKEWAYAGMAIDLVAAFVSHLVVDGVGQKIVPPLIFLVVLVVSYAWRPDSRRLAGVRW